MPTTMAFTAALPLRTGAPAFSPGRTPIHTRRPRVRMTVEPPRPTGPLRSIRDFLDGVRRVSGLGESLSDPEIELDSGGALFRDDDDPPTVLVVGATGETGRIVVRKLILRGYRVRVLVRDLYSATLDILGTGVQYVKGDIADYDSLFEAVGDVDKVVCTVGTPDAAAAEEVEFRGVARLIRAFHDARIAYYGRAEATKLVLFNFGAERDLARWKRVVPAMGAEGARAPRCNFQRTGANRVAFMGQVFSMYSGRAEIRCDPAVFNLADFSGLILRCVGDGKRYTAVLRTAGGVKAGVEYAAGFDTHLHKWGTVRIPFSAFRARPLPTAPDADPAPQISLADAPRLRRGGVRQIALQYEKPSVSPEKDDGRFYLAVDYLKAYRTQETPDFVLVSCASVTSRDLKTLDEEGLRSVASEDRTAWKYMSEKRLRQSGLTYCIVRPGTFTDQPGGNKAIMLEQGGDVSGAISRADVAEICVQSLLDPRACNVTFDAFESMYAPTAMRPEQNVSAMLSRLQPNT